MTKYKEYCQRMIDTNKEIFDEFGKIHALYDLDQDKWREKFNKEGEKIVKKEFPLVDHVGIIIKHFTIKKINLE